MCVHLLRGSLSILLSAIKYCPDEKNDRSQYLVVGRFLKYIGFETDITVKSGGGFF
jgi:hypothetical protein